jgi:hypothetical protein
MSLLPAPEWHAEEAGPDRRLLFARYQVAKLAGFLASDAPVGTGAALLQKTGRECARLGGLPSRFQGNPEGYIAATKQAWGTDIVWNREAGTLTVAVAEGECGCPLVDSRRTPAFWCNCSVGYQKEAFETVFGLPVEVSLKASKLDGSPRCVFEIRLV